MKATRKIAFIALALVIALVGTGVAYAMWSDTITINGQVNTGSVKVGINDQGTCDPGPSLTQKGGVVYPVNSPIDGTLDHSWLQGVEAKNVASTNSENGTDLVGTIGDVNFYESVTETISNAYPFYKSGTTLLLGNLGTIPVKILDINTIKLVDENGILDYLIIDSWYLDKNGVKFDEGTGDLSALVAAIGHYQIEPGDYLSVHIGFHFAETFDNEVNVMPQGANASFEFEVICAQWNEVSDLK